MVAWTCPWCDEVSGRELEELIAASLTCPTCGTCIDIADGTSAIDAAPLAEAA